MMAPGPVSTAQLQLHKPADHCMCLTADRPCSHNKDAWRTCMLTMLCWAESCWCCLSSGAISEPQVIAQFLALLAGGLGISYTLDRWAGHDFPILFCLAVFGSFISYIYSAPPLKLKQSGWIGNYALGSSYIALPWWAGQVSWVQAVGLRAS